jgi:methylamine dehydrogenase accessory protein MauD
VTGIWLVSYAILWVLLLLLVLVVIALARQIGLLHKRLRPVGARMTNSGPEIGQRISDPIRGLDLQGQLIAVHAKPFRQTLLVFVSPNCVSCSELAPALGSLWRSERVRLDLVIIAISGEVEDNRKFAVQYKLDRIPFLISKSAGHEFSITNTPYGVLIDQQNSVRAKGIVNNTDHLESLLNAAEVGHPSWDSLMEVEHEQSQKALGPPSSEQTQNV